MFWRSHEDGGLPDPGAEFRRVHERWLTRALASSRPIPRIPVRRADSGGFDRLLARPGGRALADRWWALAMSIADAE
jgi:hypothetical protein